MIQIKEFVKIVNGEFISGNPHSVIGRVSTDTRTLSEGDCFFALEGAGGSRDGHNYIKDAVRRNASAIVYSKDDISVGGDEKILLNFPSLIKVKDTLRALGDYARYVRESFGGKVVCVAGSNGKTTVKNMIYSMLSLVGKTHKSPGNYNNLIGLPLTILSIEGDENFVVLEAGISVKGEMERLGEISMPDVAVLTNVGREHLEGLSDMKTVVEEETKIFNYVKPKGAVVINLDNIPHISDIVSKIFSQYSGEREIKIIGFSMKSDIKVPDGFNAVLGASDVFCAEDGVSFVIDYGGEREKIFLKVNGTFNVSNALAASACCYALGVPLKKVKEGLEGFAAVPGRMQKLQLPNGCIVVNDAYNANPDSMRASLNSFVEMYPRKSKILVLADMLELGEHSAKEHSDLGEFVMTLPFEEVLLVGGNMRHAYKRMKEIYDAAAVRHFESTQELANEIFGSKRYFSSENALFFKGSHSMGLEDVANKFYNIGALEV